MTIEQLYQVLKKAVDDGHGSGNILFDTEARKFDYHMAKVGSAYVEDQFDPDRPFLWLSEERVTA